MKVVEGEDVYVHFTLAGTDSRETAGFVYPYDKTYDRLSPRTPKPLQVIERAIYNPTTTDDPMMEQLSESNAATVFATDSILSMMMCANRSVYPWDIVVVREGDKVYFDKRPNSAFGTPYRGSPLI
jgi:translation initiation factor 3 subunit D